jgi:hypothetical protein
MTNQGTGARISSKARTFDTHSSGAMTWVLTDQRESASEAFVRSHHPKTVDLNGLSKATRSIKSSLSSRFPPEKVDSIGAEKY